MGIRILKWIGIALLALVLLVAALVLGLNTSPGRRFLVDQANAFKLASGMGFRIGRIDGSIYGRMVIRDFAVTDTRGAFMTAPVLVVDWRPFKYIHSAIDVRDFEAPSATLLRTPVLIPQPSDPNAPLLPDIDLSIAKLHVGRFTIEPAVTGKRSIASIDGRAAIAHGRAQVFADARTIAAPGVAGGDHAVVNLDAVPGENRLVIAARMDAPAGGLVDSYAGLGKPIHAVLDGKGDWHGWRGAVTASLAGQSIADLALTGQDGRFRLAGTTRPGLVLTGPAARLVEPGLSVDGTATLGQRRADTHLVLASDAVRVEAGGLLDFANSRFGRFAVAAKLFKPAMIAAGASGRDIALNAVLDGAFTRPTVQYELAAAAARFGATGIEGLHASGKATIDTNRILVPLHATARRVSGLNPAVGGLLTDIAIDGNLAYTNGRLISDDLRLRSRAINATALVLADFGTGTYTGAMKGRINDYHVDGIGRFSLDTDAHLVPGRHGGFGVAGRFRLLSRTLENQGLKTFLGGNALVAGDIGYGEDGTATVRNLLVRSPDFRMTGATGSYRTADGRLTFNANAVSRAYGPLSVRTTGTVANPIVHLVAARPGLGVGLNGVVADLTGSAAGYRVRTHGGSDYGPFEADLLVRAGQGPLAIDIHRALFAGITLAGSIVQTAAGPYAGALTLAGAGFNGSARLANASGSQQVSFDVTAANAHVPGPMAIAVATGHVTGSALLLASGPQLNADATLGGVTYGTTTVSAARARVRYAGGRGQVALTASGNAGVPFNVAAQADLSPSRVLANLRGVANGIAFHLAQPALANKIGRDWVLAPATLVVPQGSMTVSGRYGATTQAHAVLNSLDMGIVDAVAPGLGIGGRASGTVDYTGGGSVPNVRARLDLAGFTRTSAVMVSEPVDVALLATLGEPGGDMRALVKRRGTIVGRVQVRLAPLAGGASLTQRLMGAPLSGGIRYSGPADVLWTLAGQAGQSLTGGIAIGADFGGRLAQPTLTGVVRANALRYENETYGTVLSGMAIDGRFTQSQFRLNSLTAKAGSGSVSASGTVGLDAAGGFPMDLTATLQKAQLARSDALGATVSGSIHVTNSRQAGALISGDLSIPNARYQIVTQSATAVPELTGVRRKGAPPSQPVAPSAAPSLWKLALRVHADNQIFVSGMGLESEWKIDLRVGGTSAAPQVAGNMQIIRGTYSFSGRRFDIGHGRVDFLGNALTNPDIDIAATTTVEGVTATINITGRAQNPQISFTSTPSLPQDEVLSRLLFGSSVTNLSPTQAIQLASALNGLRGSSGGGINPIGKLRSATGIDRLRVLGADKTTGQGTSIAAGQYISNNIYVEVITDARGFTATQLEISLSKALSILSSTSTFGGTSASLRYSKDY